MKLRRDCLRLAIPGVSMLSLASLFGCSPRSPTRPSPKATRTISAFAASSTQDALTFVEQDFKKIRPELTLRFHFAGSQVLRMQIEQGAPADLFISANRKHMELLHQARRIQRPKILAQNRLALVVPKNNPAKLHTFADLPQASRIVIGLPSVPIGQYTQNLLTRANTKFGPDFAAQVRRKVVSRESNVRLIRSKVQLGAADAAFIYTTDLFQATGLSSIPIPPELQIQTSYWVATTMSTKNDCGAQQLIEYLLSPPGQDSLSKAGFRSHLL